MAGGKGKRASPPNRAVATAANHAGSTPQVNGKAAAAPTPAAAATTVNGTASTSSSSGPASAASTAGSSAASSTASSVSGDSAASAAAAARQLALAATDVSSVLLSADDLTNNWRETLTAPHWSGGSTDPLNSSVSLDVLRARITELEELSREEQEAQRQQDEAIAEAVRDISDAFASDAPLEKKIEFVQTRYIEILRDAADTDLLIARTHRKLDVLTKERDTAWAELNRVTAMNAKLESLCRELQKENKRQKEESRRSLEAELARREELSAKFTEALAEMRAKLQQGEAKLKRTPENEQVRLQLRNLLEQYEVREKHFKAILEIKDLEHRLCEARLQQQTEIAAQEQQKALALRQQAELAAQREAEVRQQVDTYADKFEQIQEAINKSNEVFGAFKREMDAMTKKLRRMERENETLKSKCDVMNKDIQDLLDERERTSKTLDTLQNQKAKLENLSRVLQSERRDLREQLERHQRFLQDHDLALPPPGTVDGGATAGAAASPRLGAAELAGASTSAGADGHATPPRDASSGAASPVLPVTGKAGAAIGGPAANAAAAVQAREIAQTS